MVGKTWNSKDRLTYELDSHRPGHLQEKIAQRDDTFDLIASCIDQVYTEEESWTSDECTKKELSDFVESLNSSQFKLVENFFVTMPKLSHTIKVTNPNTKVESDVKIEGLQSFFG